MLRSAHDSAARSLARTALDIPSYTVCGGGAPARLPAAAGASPPLVLSARRTERRTACATLSIPPSLPRPSAPLACPPRRLATNTLISSDRVTITDLPHSPDRSFLPGYLTAAPADVYHLVYSNTNVLKIIYESYCIHVLYIFISM